MSSPGPTIVRKSLLAGAREAVGIVVVIVVLRAFTTAAFLLHLGAERIILLREVDDALRLKQRFNYLAVGEVNGVKPPGFDLGNSPSEILAAELNALVGQTVVQRTSAGVQGAVAAARRADVIFLGSYVTAAATAHSIQCLAPLPEVVTLVAMGEGGEGHAPDDERCADYLEHLLTGRPYNPTAALKEVIDHPCTSKFLSGRHAHYPPSAPIYCLQPDLFDFAIIASVVDGILVAQP